LCVGTLFQRLFATFLKRNPGTAIASRDDVMPSARALEVALLIGSALLIDTLGCGSSNGDPGPSWRAFDEILRNGQNPQAAIVLVVDDRPSARAAELRAGIGPAMRQLGSDGVRRALGFAPDWATWHPIDVAVVIIAASARSLDAVISPAQDARLAWITKHATAKDADALAVAVEQRVRGLTAPEGAPFQPLARVREVVDLLTQTRMPASEVEASLLAAVSPRGKLIGVSIVATTDDESPEPPTFYRLPPDISVAGLATSERNSLGESNPAVYPRLIAWAQGVLGSPFSGCGEESRPPFMLFRGRCVGAFQLRCPGYSVAQSSAGLGRCHIQVTPSEPVGCEPNRGWADPLDSDGVRRPRLTDQGAHLCDMMPVDPGVMDACIHDETCADCGSGWCITKVLPHARYCPKGVGPLPIRWVGGALPAPGLVHITCLEDSDAPP
jgi:hypothetical protein